MGLESGMRWNEMGESTSYKVMQVSSCQLLIVVTVVQVRCALYQMMTPWLAKLVRKAVNATPHSQVWKQSSLF